jgi:clathrin heavy chain
MANKSFNELIPLDL